MSKPKYKPAGPPPIQTIFIRRSKFTFILNSLDQNYFNTNYFSWIDFNLLSKSPYDIDYYTNDLVYEKLNKIAEFPRDKFTVTILNFWDPLIYNDLKEFYKNLGNERWSKTNKYNSTLTVKDLIIKIGNKIKNDLSSFKGFIEDGQWSSLNKIDTNYSYWAKSIIDLDNKGLLGNGSPKEKIEEFFKQRLPKDICTPQEVLHIKDIQKNYRGF
jgi:hypothetical protein